MSEIVIGPRFAPNAVLSQSQKDIGGGRRGASEGRHDEDRNGNGAAGGGETLGTTKTLIYKMFLEFHIPKDGASRT